ncbi:MAG: hypothetical protein Q7S40_00545 [Opitutaceae bacterium]|nr:hypothetical protein [Opitutaceae bacterium]
MTRIGSPSGTWAALFGESPMGKMCLRMAETKELRAYFFCDRHVSNRREFVVLRGEGIPAVKEANDGVRLLIFHLA